MAAHDDLSNRSMMELFREEVENQSAILTGVLLELEREEASTAQLESLMRAAHSLKGGARIISLADAVLVSHAMEDCFVAAQQGKLRLRQAEIDILLHGVDLLGQIAKRGEAGTTPGMPPDLEVEKFLENIAALMPGKTTGGPEPPALPAGPAAGINLTSPASTQRIVTVQSSQMVSNGETGLQPPALKQESHDRYLRLTAENLNRLLGLAGESLVESRWLRPFTESMQRLKRMHTDMEDALDSLRQSLEEEEISEQTQVRLDDVFHRSTETRQYLGERMQELDLFDRRSAQLSNRLYLEVLRARMRPFADGVRQFPRMVRDLARSLGKQVRLEELMKVEEER